MVTRDPTKLPKFDMMNGLANQDKFNSNYAMQKNLKPIWSKDSGLPQFFLPKFSGKDKRSSVGTQFKLAPPTNPNAVIKNKGNTYEVMQRAQPKGGIQTSTGYIMEDTLFKQNKFGYTGLDTIHGMSEQYITTTNKDGTKTDTLVRGSNYANINYPSYEYTDMKTKKAAEAAKISSAAKKETANKLYELTGGLIGKAPPPLPKSETDNKGGSEGTGSIDTGRPDGNVYAVKSYSGSKASRRAKAKYLQRLNLIRTPGLGKANQIQSELGRGKIVPYIKRNSWLRKDGSREYSKRYDWLLSGNPQAVIKDYNKKTGLISWAKTIDPEHASVTNYSNKGEEMDMVYDKVIKKSKEKKTKYKTFYDTSSDVEDYNYYAVGDEDFTAFKEHKDYLLGDISYRRSNQKEIINRLKLDAKTIEQKDRSGSIIPTLESDIDTLDTKSTIIKKQLGEHDWQKGISQDAFGTDTIHGESHVSGVLDSYGGQVRGGNYYVQDVGHLIKNTKEYESELKTEIKQHTSEIESIEPDETDSLVDYFNDKSTKENAIASKDYLSKSLELTKEDRIKLERARNASAYGENQQSTRARPKQSRGKPNPRKRSSQGGSQYKNTRTRGGQNNLGGLVI